MKNKTIIVSILLIIGFAQRSYAQEQTNTDITNTIESNAGFLDDFYLGVDTPAPPIETESPVLTLFRIALITGTLAFLTWVMIRFFFRRNTLSISTEGKSIEILATIPAGLGSYFLVAKLHSLYYLFSLSNDGLRLLDKITDQEAIDFIELNRVQTLPQDIQFVDLLDKLPEGAPKKALEFLREKINYLKKKD
ncbi:MAG: hypothetical protein ACRCWI_01050 [Brevinema sp.]